MLLGLWAPACCESLCVCTFCSVHAVLFIGTSSSFLSGSVCHEVCVGGQQCNGSMSQRMRLFKHGGSLLSPNVVKVMIHSMIQWCSGLHNDTIMITAIRKKQGWIEKLVFVHPKKTAEWRLYCMWKDCYMYHRRIPWSKNTVIIEQSSTKSFAEINRTQTL